MNLWKIVSGVIALVVLTALTTGYTVAYLIRPGELAQPAAAVAAAPLAPSPAIASPTPARRVANVRRVSASTVARPPVVEPRATVATAPPEPVAAVATPAPVVVTPPPVPTAPPVATPEPVATPAPARPPVAASTQASQPAVRPVATASAADCSTGGDRALRIAKPGALGALLGAGLGAAGGAIANGGRGAGKGAMIGGLAGAVLGSGYGAYKTKQECGTILGNGSGFSGDGVNGVARSGGVTHASNDHASDIQPAFQYSQDATSSAAGDRIQVYNAR